MNKTDMIDLLLKDMREQGGKVTPRERLERWSATKLKRELELRGLIEFEDDDRFAVEDDWEPEGSVESFVRPPWDQLHAYD